MLKSSLLEIIRTFTKQELIRFEDFVQSPYFNKNKNAVSLFMAIRKSAPEFTDEDLQKEKVWMNLFPGKEYNYGIMKNIIHDLTQLSEKFILLEKYCEDSLSCELDLIEAASNRKLQKFTSGKLDQFEKKLKQKTDPDKYSSINQVLRFTSNFSDSKAGFIHEYNLKEDRQDHLRKASDYLLFDFLVRSFKLIHNTFANEVYGKNPVRNTLLEKFFMKLKEYSILDEVLLKNNKDQDNTSKIVTCFYYMFKAVTSKGNMADYNKFKSYLRENVELLSGFELMNLNNCRHNITLLLKIPDSESAKESLEWYKFLMDKNIMLIWNGLIDVSTVLNVVNYSVRLKEIPFAEEFLKRYAEKLPPDTRGNTYNYCMAVINFGKKDFGKSLESLSLISDEVLIRKYHMKRLYLKNYYELNDYESFLYALDTYAHFKKRNKLINETKAKGFDDFGNNIRRLFKLRNSYDSFEAAKLRKEAGGQTWFEEKLDELEKGNR